MQNYNFKTNSEDETMKLGEKLAKLCAPKDIIVLSGELGAGKTKFTEGFLKYFGLDDEISSPTFTIVNEYTKNDINIYHFDVYRLEDSSEFYEIGGEEYFENGICLIEWGELIDDAIPKDHLEIKISKSDENDNMRIINITSYGNRYDVMLDNLKEEV